jgi:hypothetical protein
MNNNQIAAGAKNANETACSRIHGRCPLVRIFALIVLPLTDPTTQKNMAALNNDSHRVVIGVRVAH